MPNEDRPTGAQVIGDHSGRYQGHLTRMFIPASDPTATFINDVVNISGSADSNGVTAVTQSTGNLVTGGPPCGIIVAMEPDYTNLAIKYRLPFTARYVWVNTDPQVRFEIQATDIVYTLMIRFVFPILVSPGSTVSGISGMELDAEFVFPSNGLLMLKGFSQRPNNSSGFGVPFTKVICSFAWHQYGDRPAPRID